MREALTIKTEPAVEPVSVAEAKAHANVTHATDDTLIGTYIVAARRLVEAISHRQLITATWDLYLDAFPSVIRPPLPPLQSPVVHLKYYDTDGVLRTLTVTTDYTVDADSEPGRVQPAYSQSWPSVRAIPNTINLQFKAGYGDASTDVPDHFILAIKMLVAQYYEMRMPVSAMKMSEIPYAVLALVVQDTAWRF